MTTVTLNTLGTPVTNPEPDYEAACGAVLRDLSYWMGRKGPKMPRGHQLVKADLSLEPVAEGYNWRNSVLGRTDVIGVMSFLPVPNEFSAKLYLYGSHYGSGTTAEEALADARAKMEAAKAEAEKVAGDSVYALEQALKGRDWFANYSDDFRVMRRGDAQAKRVNDLMVEVGRETAEPMFNKYAPEGFRFPERLFSEEG